MASGLARYLTVLTVVMLIPAVALAAGNLGLYEDSGGTDPEVIAPAGSVIEFYVVLQTAESYQAVWFRTDANAEFQNKTIYLGVVDMGYSVQGNVVDGVTIFFGTCLTGIQPVAILRYLVTDAIDCGTLTIVPHPGYVDVQGQLCSGGVTPLIGGRGYAASQPAHFADRSPANGATGVPLDADLSWTASYCYVAGDCFGDQCRGVLFGTDPGNLATFAYTNPFEPGPLQPNTTYYWSVYNNAASSSLWSFTTAEGPVATEPTTWSRVKALYR